MKRSLMVGDHILCDDATASVVIIKIEIQSLQRSNPDVFVTYRYFAPDGATGIETQSLGNFKSSYLEGA